MSNRTTVIQPTLSLRSVLEKDKLTGTNFIDWYHNLWNVLKFERVLYVLEIPLPEDPIIGQMITYNKHYNDSEDVAVYMLNAMSQEFQDGFKEVSRAAGHIFGHAPKQDRENDQHQHRRHQPHQHLIGQVERPDVHVHVVRKHVIERICGGQKGVHGHDSSTIRRLPLAPTSASE